MSALARLKQARDEVAAAIRKLETMVRLDQPDRAELAMTRWKLTQTSRKRRQLLEDVVYPEIELRSMEQSPALKHLRAADAGLIAASAQHIADWDIDTIMKRWGDYRRISTGLMEELRRRIDQEKNVLYPMLGEAADG